MNKSISGESYRHCIAWRVKAGYGNACFDMCPKEQREKCSKQQDIDNNEIKFCPEELIKAVEETRDMIKKEKNEKTRANESHRTP